MITGMCGLLRSLGISSDGKLTIRRCAVFQKSGEPPWTSLPRIPIEKNGKKQYVLLLDLPRALKQRVLQAVLEEYRRVVAARLKSSPGVSGHKCQQSRWGLRTGDGVRQETPS